jgi:SAM-dependent methyltransferase
VQPGEVKRHWERLAHEHGTALDATTKTPTIKVLEIAALTRAFHRAGLEGRTSATVLEVGCGNGYNCLELATTFSNAQFTGVDYVPEMIENARAAAATRASAVGFEVGNVLGLNEHTSLADAYDIVFTDRCLINLATLDEQLVGLRQLAAKVRLGGHLVILENTAQAFARQNDLRESAGLSRRVPPSHNLFIDEGPFLECAEDLLLLEGVDEFAALHDLLLYVLVPMTNGGAVDYEAPIVKAVTDLLLALPGATAAQDAGQNRLFLFRTGDIDVGDGIQPGDWS